MKNSHYFRKTHNFKIIPNSVMRLSESNSTDFEKLVTSEYQFKIMKSDLNSIKFYDIP